MNIMITTCLNTLAKNFHIKNRNPINNNAPIVSATFIVNPSIASPHKVRGSKIEDRRSRHEDRGYRIASHVGAREFTFATRSWSLADRSSVLDPRSSISERQKIERRRYQKSDAHEIAENVRAVSDALPRSVMLGRERGERHRDQQTEQDQSRKMRHAFLPIPMS